MITLQVKRPLRLPLEKSILLNAAEVALNLTARDTRTDLSIVIGNDALLKKLNHQYRGVNSSTDVLSFPSGEIDPDSADLYLGDIIISLPKAQEQAATGGHSLSDELQLLVVHGVLHLLGYDHSNSSDKKNMQAAQDKILAALRIDLRILL